MPESYVNQPRWKEIATQLLLRHAAGASPKVAAALIPDRTSLTRGELAAIAVARSLARVPCELTAGERAELVDAYGERNAEWVVLGAVMMG